VKIYDTINPRILWNNSFSKVSDVIFYFLLVLAFAINLRLTIPYDGFNYLSSGSSIFTFNFPEWYQLMREPAYSLLVKIATFFPNAIIAFMIIQSFMIGVSITILSRICIQYLKIHKFIAHTISIIGLLSIRGYASSVLQQSLIILLSMVGLYLSLRIERDQIVRNSYFVFFAYGVAISSTNLALLVSACLSIGILVLLRKNLHLIRKIVLPILLGSQRF